MSILKGLSDRMERLGSLVQFAFKAARTLVSSRPDLREWIRQGYLLGNRSLGLVAVTAFIVGLVLTVQSRPTLAMFGAEGWLPSMVAISIIKEIGPVITALVCAGKIGSGIGAEVASMKVSEQIDAMDVSGINPHAYIVVPRMMAATLVVPVLVLLGDAASIVGSYVGMVMTAPIDPSLFITQAFENLEFSDLLPAVAKTVVFGLYIGLIGTHCGFESEPGPSGVAKATNRSVVTGIFGVFLIDLFFVNLTNLIFGS
ncbi:MAG: ABC transporter permease [Holophaga sp.]|nr:ABC transporter permease [Holophaga sp.]